MSTPAPEHSRPVLSWVHFGDLHLTRADEQNDLDFQALVQHANANLKGQTDFAVLPGDNAEDGTAEQFSLVARTIDRLEIPLEFRATMMRSPEASTSIGNGLSRSFGCTVGWRISLHLPQLQGQWKAEGLRVRFGPARLAQRRTRDGRSCRGTSRPVHAHLPK